MEDILAGHISQHLMLLVMATGPSCSPSFFLRPGGGALTKGSAPWHASGRTIIAPRECIPLSVTRDVTQERTAVTKEIIQVLPL